jgi:hypothetical protein
MKKIIIVFFLATTGIDIFLSFWLFNEFNFVVQFENNAIVKHFIYWVVVSLGTRTGPKIIFFIVLPAFFGLASFLVSLCWFKRFSWIYDKWRWAYFLIFGAKLITLVIWGLFLYEYFNEAPEELIIFKNALTFIL